MHIIGYFCSYITLLCRTLALILTFLLDLKLLLHPILLIYVVSLRLSSILTFSHVIQKLSISAFVVSSLCKTMKMKCLHAVTAAQSSSEPLGFELQKKKKKQLLIIISIQKNSPMRDSSYLQPWFWKSCRALHNLNRHDENSSPMGGFFFFSPVYTFHNAQMLNVCVNFGSCACWSKFLHREQKTHSDTSR